MAPSRQTRASEFTAPALAQAHDAASHGANGNDSKIVAIGHIQAVRNRISELFGSGPSLTEVVDTAARVAETDAPVLISGENGVGKDFLARIIHDCSPHGNGPFIKVNCAAISADALSNELFGNKHGNMEEHGRFRPGKLELADTGTLYLDEIGDMHLSTQARLLDALQEGVLLRLSIGSGLPPDVRLLCATTKPLEKRLAEGLFREDLFYRINVVPIHIPPLRERQQEIPILTSQFLEKYSALYGRELPTFTPEASAALLHYSWPGNVRELENLCKRFVIVGHEDLILHEISASSESDELAESLKSDFGSRMEDSLQTGQIVAIAGIADIVSSLDAGQSLVEIGRRAAWEAEKRAIQYVLSGTHWNRREAARRLKVSYKALLNKIKRLQLGV